MVLLYRTPYTFVFYKLSANYLFIVWKLSNVKIKLTKMLTVSRALLNLCVVMQVWEVQPAMTRTSEPRIGARKGRAPLSSRLFLPAFLTSVWITDCLKRCAVLRLPVDLVPWGWAQEKKWQNNTFHFLWQNIVFFKRKCTARFCKYVMKTAYL